MYSFINFFLEINYSEKHKKITNEVKVFFIGGLLFLIGILFTSIPLDIKMFCVIMYIIGISSDKKYLSSPNLRLFLQTSLIIVSIYVLKIQINETRLPIIDNFLDKGFFSIIFTTFCILILINGSNFIDGINCNLILYYLLITFLFIFVNHDNFFSLINRKDLIIISIFLSSTLLLNFLGKITSGDSGAYLLSYIWGLNLIQISSNNSFVSPFFIVLLLWYPAFENLFSIIRKLKLNKSALEADFNHLHQLLFLLINLKIKNKRLANNLSGILINTYNLLIFTYAINYYNHTDIMIMLTLMNLTVYLLSYFLILNFIKKVLKK
jgi:UDP-N-acetylmuramyl pentapeptide phosphotransferase/UDP-N-acetylglucosamine-1-phosphate transferase